MSDTMSWRKLYKKLYEEYYGVETEPEEVDLEQNRTRHPFFCFTTDTYNTAHVNLKDTLRRSRPDSTARVVPFVTKIKSILNASEDMADEEMSDAKDPIKIDWGNQTLMHLIFTDGEEAGSNKFIGYYKILDAYHCSIRRWRATASRHDCVRIRQFDRQIHEIATYRPRIAPQVTEEGHVHDLGHPRRTPCRSMVSLLL